MDYGYDKTMQQNHKDANSLFIKISLKLSVHLIHFDHEHRAFPIAFLSPSSLSLSFSLRVWSGIYWANSRKGSKNLSE